MLDSQDMHTDYPHPLKVTFHGLNNKRFIITFSPSVDKQEDFTVDPSQLMRIAKGDVSHIYHRLPNATQEEVFDIKLSAVSGEDAFLSVKQRIRRVLDFLKESENLSDSVPNVLS
jgi:hypothetical protein